MSLTLHLDEAAKLVEIRVTDTVSWEAFHSIVPPLEDFVLSHGAVRVLEVIEHFEGLDPDLLWDGLRLDRKIMPHITHIAMVGNRRWLDPLRHAQTALLPTRLRLFDNRHEAAARQWLLRADRMRTHVVQVDPGQRRSMAGAGPHTAARLRRGFAGVP